MNRSLDKIENLTSGELKFRLPDRSLGKIQNLNCGKDEVKPKPVLEQD